VALSPRHLLLTLTFEESTSPGMPDQAQDLVLQVEANRE
jgi:hypothetical protein